MDPRRANAELVALDRQLRELLRANPLATQDAQTLRRRLMEAATRLVDANPTFAALKEVEQALWKPCFYRRIEDFRRRIRKYAAAAQADRNVRDHFAQVWSEFQTFLTESAGFYAHLRDVYAKWLQRNGSESAESSKVRHSLHRCYVFLGDLARYRELHSQKGKKNFAAAEALYHRALVVLPENGNPHNQLAVLATYVEAETVAVYRYCRSLLTSQPFTTAEENLALLFERSRQRPLAPPVTFTSPSPSSKEKSAFLKSYLHRLTRMHGILFALSSPRGSPTASGRDTTGNAPAPKYPRDMETLLFRDMQTLLRAGVVGDALLLKVVVTNIFCVIRSVKSQAQSAPVEDALRLTLRTITSVVEYLSENLDAKTKASVNGEKAAKDPTLSALRLLGPVVVFCDYLESHPEVLEKLEHLLAPRNKQLPGNDGKSEHDAASDHFALGFLEALAKLVNNARSRELYAPLLVGAGQQHGDDMPSIVREQEHMLKESLELRGFAPLEKNATAVKGQDDWVLQTSVGGSAATPLADADSAKIRAWKLYHFARFLCDGYEGDPLLFCGPTGQFATAPVVGKANPQQDNGASEVVASLNLGFLASNSTMEQAPHQPSNGQHTGTSTAVDDDDDDFEDEVIVFQPSPALTGMSGNKQPGSYMANAPSPLDTLSNGGAFSLRAPSPISPPEDQGRMSTISQSSTFAGSENGSIGSSLGYPSFHTFSDAGSFSGQGLLSGWGNSANTNNTNNSNGNMLGGNLGMGMGFGFRGGNGADPVFMMPSTTSSFTAPQRFGGNASESRPFAPMADLAAVERELARYQQRGSSLSAFMGASTPASQSDMQDPSPPRAPTRPPPGFGGAAMSGQQSLHMANSYSNP